MIFVVSIFVFDVEFGTIGILDSYISVDFMLNKLDSIAFNSRIVEFVAIGMLYSYISVDFIFDKLDSIKLVVSIFVSIILLLLFVSDSAVIVDFLWML